MVLVSICWHCIHHIDGCCKVSAYPDMKMDVPCFFPCPEGKFKTNEPELFESD